MSCIRMDPTSNVIHQNGIRLLMSCIRMDPTSTVLHQNGTRLLMTCSKMDPTSNVMHQNGTRRLMPCIRMDPTSNVMHQNGPDFECVSRQRTTTHFSIIYGFVFSTPGNLMSCLDYPSQAKEKETHLTSGHSTCRTRGSHHINETFLTTRHQCQ